MKISIIAAIGESFELGKQNGLLWHLPDDFKWFVQKTKNKSVIMGRNTMVSLGKPLKNRLNIVLSSKESDILDGFVHAFNWDDALKLAEEFCSEEAMIIGGGIIYTQAIDFCDVLYLTRVHALFPEADTYFPSFNLDKWECVELTPHSSDEFHDYSFEFQVFENIDRRENILRSI